MSAVDLDSFEVESFISSDEFLEKTLEEFVRCDVSGCGRLSPSQLLLACLHLEQDLRALMPPHAPKHRQPTQADVDIILRKYAKPNGREIECEQFVEFARVLFRNVCARVRT